MMLYLMRAPFSLRSAHDVASEETRRVLEELGMDCVLRDLCPEGAARGLFHAGIPGARALLKQGPARWRAGRVVREPGAGDVAWVFGQAWLWDATCRFEQKLKEGGGAYIFYLIDDWFSDPVLKDCALRRVEMADAVVVVTPALRERVLEMVPGAKVRFLEEPVDVNRLDPASHGSSDGGLPVVVWCGNSNNLKELPAMIDILERLYRERKFELRIISGARRPNFDISIPWEWRPYRYEDEARELAGAAAGIAPVKDSPYARCKDTYKIKTYSAAGVATVASRVGYNEFLVRDRETGRLCESDDDWFEALRELIVDEARARELGAKARADCVARFSHRATLPKWAEFLREEFGARGSVGKSVEVSA